MSHISKYKINFVVICNIVFQSMEIKRDTCVHKYLKICIFGLFTLRYLLFMRGSFEKTNIRIQTHKHIHTRTI